MYVNAYYFFCPPGPPMYGASFSLVGLDLRHMWFIVLLASMPLWGFICIVILGRTQMFFDDKSVGCMRNFVSGKTIIRSMNKKIKKTSTSNGRRAAASEAALLPFIAACPPLLLCCTLVGIRLTLFPLSIRTGVLLPELLE
jgi:hypothetical protein